MGNSRVHICFGGQTHRIETYLGVVLFEDHPYCGPLPCNKDGNGRNLAASHPFWTAVSRWYATGKRTRRVGRNLWCVTCASPTEEPGTTRAPKGPTAADDAGDGSEG
jgi:hypothetical protein